MCLTLRARRVLENKSGIDDARIDQLELDFKRCEALSMEAERKYDEVNKVVFCNVPNLFCREDRDEWSSNILR